MDRKDQLITSNKGDTEGRAERKQGNLSTQKLKPLQGAKLKRDSLCNR